MALTKLDTEMHKRLVAYVERGLTYARAAQACGIGYSTFKQWMARGRKEKRGIYADFAAAIKKADAVCEGWHLENIRKHAVKSWQASAWTLERKFPDRWTKRSFGEMAEAAAKTQKLSKEDMQKAIEDVFRN
jgi:hypothetical protein